jgi:chromosome partitioning protein
MLNSGETFCEFAPQNGISDSKILVISSAKGGSGKTTTTRNLAICALHDGFSVATIDLDAQGSLTLWYQRRPEEAPSFEHFKVPIAEGPEALDSVASTKANLIIVDTPPGVDADPAAIREVIRRADFVLIPTGQGAPDTETVIGWAKFIRREGCRSAFLLNRSARGKNSFNEAKLELSRVGALCPFDVRDLEDIQRTHRTGLGVIEVRGAIGSVDLAGVWNYVRNEIGLGDTI